MRVPKYARWRDLAIFATGCVSASTAFLLFDPDKESLPPAMHVRRLISTVQSKSVSKLPASPAPPNTTSVDGSLQSHFQTSDEPSFKAFAPLPRAVHEVGLPSLEVIKVHDGFLHLYDRRTRTPRWVLEHLTPAKLSKNGRIDVPRQQLEFYEDPSENELFRSSNEDYFGKGYDRGHMAAAGNHRFEPKSKAETFILSNIAPQVGDGFNRHAWCDLEKYVRQMAYQNANVVVVTGPLFLPSRQSDSRLPRHVEYNVIGANNVAVPTHFFKAVALQRTPGEPWKTYAWVMPNKELPKDVAVNSFIVPLKDVERAAGFLIFPNIFHA